MAWRPWVALASSLVELVSALVQRRNRGRELEASRDLAPDSDSEVRVSQLNPETLTAEQMLEAYRAGGFRVFTGDLNVNLFGIRTGLKAGAWDDWIGVLYQNGQAAWQLSIYAGTTDPSDVWLERGNDSRGGTAILVPGQYLSCWQLGEHRGQYKALVQTGPKPMTVYRDGNLDDRLDMDPSTEQTGWFGINLHRASSYRVVPEVGEYSAGCQVIADPADFGELVGLVEASMARYGANVSYTLFDWSSQ